MNMCKRAWPAVAVTASVAEIDPAGSLKRLNELFTEVVAVLLSA